MAIVRHLLDVSKGDSLRAKLIKGGIGVGAFRMLTIPLAMVTSIILARVLGPTGFGQYAFIMSAITMMSLPLGPGLRQLITREVAGSHQDGNWPLLKGIMRRGDHAVLLGSLLLLLVLGTVAAFNASWSVQDRWTLLLVVLPLPLLIGLLGIRCATLLGLGYAVQAQFPEMLGRPGFTLLIVLGLFGLGLLDSATALASQVVAAAVVCLVATVVLHKRCPPGVRTAQPKYQTARWAKSWLPFTALMAGHTLNGQVGLLALGFLSTSPQVAGMQIAIKGGLFVILSMQVVNIVVAPYITRAHRGGNTLQLRRLFRLSAAVTIGGSVVIGVPLILFSSRIISATFGASFISSAAVPLEIVAAGQLGHALLGPTGTFLIMSDHERDPLVAEGIGLGANIFLSIVLIPVYGAVGAAIATAVALLSTKLYEFMKLQSRLHLFRFSGGLQ